MRKISVKYLFRVVFLTDSQNYFFSDLVPKNAQVVNLKNPDLDLILIIYPECGFNGFYNKKRKFRFWIQKYGFGFSKTKKEAHSEIPDIFGHRLLNVFSSVTQDRHKS